MMTAVDELIASVKGHSGNACLEWHRAIGGHGYGTVRFDGDKRLAHRVAFTIFNRTPRDGEVIRHRCDNPKCINPQHLIAGTTLDNVRDRVLRGRSARGEGNGQNKISAAVAKKIYSMDGSALAIGRETGLSSATVLRIKKGVLWSHVTGAAKKLRDDNVLKVELREAA